MLTETLPIEGSLANHDATGIQQRASRNQTATILLAEDESSYQSLLADVLEANGYHVLLARHGAAALEMAGLFEDPIHLLLTDVVMPEMSGADLAACIKTYRPDIKILFISGYSQNILQRHGDKMNGIPLLVKPFSAVDLLSKIKQLLGCVPGTAAA